MCRNRGQIQGLFDKMSSFYGQLDPHPSTMDRKTLLTLIVEAPGQEITSLNLLAWTTHRLMSLDLYNQRLFTKSCA